MTLNFNGSSDIDMSHEFEQGQSDSTYIHQTY